MAKYEVYVNSLDDLPEGQQVNLAIRTLAEGRGKYFYRYVLAEVSPEAGCYPDQLQVRFGRGQAYENNYSINILETVERIPAKYL